MGVKTHKHNKLMDTHIKISQSHPVRGNNADSFYHDKNSAAIVVYKMFVCVCMCTIICSFSCPPLISMADFEIECVEKQSSKSLS